MSTETAAPPLLTVGTRAGGGPARVAADVLAAAGVALPSASPVLGNAVAGVLAPPPAPGASRVGLDWSAALPLDPGTAVSADTVLTRVHASGVVDRHLRLLDDAGQVREQGTETWRLADSSSARPDARVDFCTQPWGDLLRESLCEDALFASALASWDGTIGLRCVDGAGGGARVVQLRIYCGRIIDVSRRVPGGATFTFEASARTWVEMLLGARNDFMRRALRGEFSSSGDGYEYLRLTKPLHLVIAHARAVAGGTSVEETQP